MSMPACPRCGRRFSRGTLVCPHDKTPLHTQLIEPAFSQTIPEQAKTPELSKTNPDAGGPGDTNEVLSSTAPGLSQTLGSTLQDNIPEKFAELAKAFAQTPTKIAKPSSLGLPTARKTLIEEPLYKGQTIGVYELQEKIGDGGMGEVWSAIHPQIHKQVAVKFLHKDFIADEASVSRFTKEAKTVNQIRHRNLLDIFAFGELDGRPYFVMEHLKGQNLKERLQSRGALQPIEILQIFEQLCDAMQATHDKGIIHRDLKPENIFLSSSTLEPIIVKVLDFGVAKLSRNDNGHITQTGALIGTLGYMSPEQFEKAKAVDARADIYSLGCILFEVLTGRPPFPKTENAASLMHLQLQAPPVPSVVAPKQDIPKEIDLLIKRTLSRNTKDRPSSCKELYQAIHDAYLAAANAEQSTTSQRPNPLLDDTTTNRREVVAPAESPTPIIEESTERSAPTEPQPVTPTPAPNNTPLKHALAGMLFAFVLFLLLVLSGKFI